ncbi:MAG: DUF1232 domain-containing protein [Bdellovibrionaceae bacterium]|jgi:uncharacterized membrane protein YkvA (DUF1232 family)|nr:DUF1232 domain-containing protein [Pseudobdellovibrionaceae bacterium]
MKKVKQIIQFLKDVANDHRIPARDKKLLLVFIGLIISPIDFIPDWIPIIGILDDLVILSIVLDYFFEYLDVEILLDHYPFGMKSFNWLRRTSKIITQFTPMWIRNRIWKFKPDVYRK